MKKLLIVSAVMLMCTGTMFAQEPQTKKTHTEQGMKKDCLKMKDGKMWMMKDGQTSEMMQDMTLSNGTKVMTNGTVMTKDGKTMMLKDGEGVGMNGKMMHGDKMKKKDGGM
jgi:hypothetical protein